MNIRSKHCNFSRFRKGIFMKKHIANILIILLALSLGINVFLGISVYKHKQREKQMTEGLCYDIACRCAAAAASINYAVEQNSRADAYYAGGMLKNLGAVMHSRAIDPRIDKYVSFGTIASVLCEDVPGIGSLTDDTPFSAEEVRILKTISEALEKLCKTFTDHPVSEYNTVAFDESIKTVDFATLNRALKDIHNTSEALWDSIANTEK